MSMFVCMCVCLNFSETTGLTSMKLGKIDNHSGVTVIREFVTS